jgi:hypothetical protein
MVELAANRRVWTTSEVQKLRALATGRVPIEEIAQVLKRSENAVRTKASLLGLARDWRWKRKPIDG